MPTRSQVGCLRQRGDIWGRPGYLQRTGVLCFTVVFAAVAALVSLGEGPSYLRPALPMISLIVAGVMARFATHIHTSVTTSDAPAFSYLRRRGS
jgi:hypothetical protein